MFASEGKEEWHYLSVQKRSILLRGVISKHHGDFCCFNCLHSFMTGNKLQSDEKACKNKDFCTLLMSSGKDNVLEFNQYMKSNKMPYFIYADI